MKDRAFLSTICAAAGKSLAAAQEGAIMKTIRVPVLFLIGTMLATGLQAQTPPHSHDHSAPKAVSQSKHGMMNADMMEHCHKMMQEHAQMTADTKAMDEKLNSLVATMNAASGKEKVDAIAAAVTELAAQRKFMQGKRATMQTDMMQHMMEHMQMGSESMSMCPMMKGMKATQSGSDKSNGHTKHH